MLDSEVAESERNTKKPKINYDESDDMVQLSRMDSAHQNDTNSVKHSDDQVSIRRGLEMDHVNDINDLNSNR